MYPNDYLNISIIANFKTNLLHFILTSGVKCARKQDLLALAFKNRKPATANSMILASPLFITKKLK